MAIPVWPVDLPQAEYSYKPQTPFIRTPMDSGLARQRRRFRVYPITAEVKFFMTPAQLATYENFAENDLGGWVSWFMLTIKDGEGLRQAKCRFLDAPVVEHVPGAGWMLSGQVETMVGLP